MTDDEVLAKYQRYCEAYQAYLKACAELRDGSKKRRAAQEAFDSSWRAVKPYMSRVRGILRTTTTGKKVKR
jgi:phage terminase small subunit